MSVVVDLGKEVKYVISPAVEKIYEIPEESVNISSVIVVEIHYNDLSAWADVLFSEEDKCLKKIVLWDGETYEKMGSNWGDPEVAARLVEILAPAES